MDEELNTAYGRNEVLTKAINNARESLLKIIGRYDLSQALSMELESVILDDLMI